MSGLPRSHFEQNLWPQHSTGTSYEPHGVSNNRQLDYLFNSLFMLTTKKTSKLRIIGSCEGIHQWLVISLRKGYITMKWNVFPRRHDEFVAAASPGFYAVSYNLQCIFKFAKALFRLKIKWFENENGLKMKMMRQTFQNFTKMIFFLVYLQHTHTHIYISILFQQRK